MRERETDGRDVHLDKEREKERRKKKRTRKKERKEKRKKKRIIYDLQIILIIIWNNIWWIYMIILCRNKEIDDSWDENEREEVSCWKYNRIRMLVDIEDKFKIWGTRNIEKYYTIK
jgi:transposase